jgi:hypothetical protein
MGSKNAKQVVYRYNGIESSDELEVDIDGEIPTPSTGGIVNRKGQVWKAVHIDTQVSSDGSIPVVRIFLSDQM